MSAGANAILRADREPVSLVEPRRRAKAEVRRREVEVPCRADVLALFFNPAPTAFAKQAQVNVRIVAVVDVGRGRERTVARSVLDPPRPRARLQRRALRAAV